MFALSIRRIKLFSWRERQFVRVVYQGQKDKRNATVSVGGTGSLYRHSLLISSVIQHALWNGIDTGTSLYFVLKAVDAQCWTVELW